MYVGCLFLLASKNVWVLAFFLFLKSLSLLIRHSWQTPFSSNFYAFQQFFNKFLLCCSPRKFRRSWGNFGDFDHQTRVRFFYSKDLAILIIYITPVDFLKEERRLSKVHNPVTLVFWVLGSLSLYWPSLFNEPENWLFEISLVYLKYKIGVYPFLTYSPFWV